MTDKTKDILTLIVCWALAFVAPAGACLIVFSGFVGGWKEGVAIAGAAFLMILTSAAWGLLTSHYNRHE